ncbi:hypothetical protein Psi01_79790 [Planobispora siamensis]|uniref:PatA-like N-terminal domain-containing protein n=1 Tax=Planobispora siamensis TaxID=936338 RepID=A0A8J3SQ71_9ACTN|nr:DUF4388 domain-containing protein [Planobispora siamensis]GIH97349.1 hypothetical protein Psi01_79790 [Planobispora siamensis]
MPTVESILTGLAGDRATGALRLGKAGVLYLTGGRVTYAETPSCPRVEDLLTASGRVSAYAVRQARQAAGEERWGGDRLVDRGVLTRGELEFCVLGAVMDAVFFLLQVTGSRSRFRPGERHWLGPQWYFDATGLVRECNRRRVQLDQAWPSTDLDTLPVVPVARIPAQRIVLTSLQWEVLVGADCTATPADLARKLGRPAYSVLLAVRQLAAAGLLCKPEAAAGDAAQARAAPALRSASSEKSPAPPRRGDPPDKAPVPDRRGESPEKSPVLPRRGDVSDPEKSPVLPRRGDVSEGSPVLPRRGGGRETRDREPGASPASPFPAGLPAATADPGDVNLLIRLRNALEALA